MNNELSIRSHLRFQLNSKTKAHVEDGLIDRHGLLFVIGERPTTVLNKNHPCDQLDVPFGSLNGCSGWLNKQLHEADIQEEKLFWLNAYDSFNRETDIKKYVSLLNPDTILTLGNVADTLCNQLQIPHVKHYHPQYWKRFRNKEPYALINCLKTYTSHQE